MVSTYQAGQVSLPCIRDPSSLLNFTHKVVCHSQPCGLSASLSATRMYLPVIKAAWGCAWEEQEPHLLEHFKSVKKLPVLFHVSDTDSRDQEL